MSTSDRTFSQVKAILNKLDRSIDEARERRTQRPVAPVTPPAAAPAAAPTPAPAASPFGRAQPIPARPVTPAPQRWGT